MKALLKYFIHSQLLISFAAGLMFMMTSHVLVDDINIGLSVFITASTYLLYNAHRIIGKSLFGSILIARRFKYMDEYRWSFYVSFLLALGYCFGYLIFKIDFFLDWKLILVPLLFSLLYVAPVINGKRLRDIAVIKIFVISLVWSWITVLWVDGIDVILSKQGAIIFVERMFFVFAITVPFDIRDELIDKESGVITLIHIFGLRQAKMIAICALLIPFVFMMIFTTHLSIDYIISYGLVLAVSSALIWSADNSKEEEYFGGYVDGMLILFPFIYFMILMI